MADITFVAAKGYVAGVIYWAQIYNPFTSLFFNGTTMVVSPALALTVITVRDPNNWGVFEINLPALLPAGVYKILVRQRAAGAAATTDNIIHEALIEKLSDDKIKFISFTNIYG